MYLLKPLVCGSSRGTATVRGPGGLSRKEVGGPASVVVIVRKSVCVTVEPRGLVLSRGEGFGCYAGSTFCLFPEREEAKERLELWLRLPLGRCLSWCSGGIRLPAASEQATELIEPRRRFLVEAVFGAGQGSLLNSKNHTTRHGRNAVDRR